jgi:hypothetical protein
MIESTSSIIDFKSSMNAVTVPRKQKGQAGSLALKQLV